MRRLTRIAAQVNLTPLGRDDFNAPLDPAIRLPIPPALERSPEIASLAILDATLAADIAACREAIDREGLRAARQQHLLRRLAE